MNQYAKQDTKSTGRQFETLKTSWKTFKSLQKHFLPLIFFLIFLPLFALELYQAQAAKDSAAFFNQQLSQNQPFINYLTIVTAYLQQYILLWVAGACFIAIGYLTCVRITFDHMRGQSHPLKLASRVQAAAKVFLKKGLLVVLIMGMCSMVLTNLLAVVLGGIEFLQIFIIVGIALSLMIPVLLMATQEGPIKTIARSFRMDIVPKIRGLKISLFFQLLTTTFLLIFGVLSIGFIRNFLMELDLFFGISRSFWFFNTAIFDLSPAYLVSLLFNSLGLSFLLLGAAIFTTVFYSNVTNPGFIALLKQMIRSETDA